MSPPRNEPRLFRVVVTGSECTGKTTLAQALARRFTAPWVPEFSRRYAEERRGQLDVSDVEPIARGHLSAEDATALGAGSLLVLDTDLVSTVVYAGHYYGDCPGWIAAAAVERRGDLYLLAQPDVPWIADGIRDRPDHRFEIHQRFVVELERLGAEVVAVAGGWAEREAVAVAAVESLLAGC
ncbi:MAG: AAA family ATPase [Acidobacteriota bacterium]